MLADHHTRSRDISRRVARGVVLGVLAAGIGWGLWQQRDRAPPPQVGKPPAGPDLLAKARELAAQGDDHGALALTDEAVRARPDDAEALLLHSEVLFRLHRSDEMIPHLRRVIERQPERFEAHANLAFAYQFAGDLERAEAEARWCLARRPEHAGVRRVLAEVRRDQGDMDGALAEVRRAQEGDAGDVQSRLLEAQLLIFQREYEAAYQALVPLYAEQLTNQRLVALLAQSAQLSGRDEEAARYREQLQSLTDRD